MMRAKDLGIRPDESKDEDKSSSKGKSDSNLNAGYEGRQQNLPYYSTLVE